MPLRAARPLPPEGLGLVLQAGGPALYAPPAPPRPWHPGFSKNRWLWRAQDPLARALCAAAGVTIPEEPLSTGREEGDAGPPLDLRPLTVLDATLGFGHDALLACRLGARVIAYEANPLMAYHTLRGLAAYDLDAATRLTVRAARCERHGALGGEEVDVVYLDPMFTAAHVRGEVASKTLRPLRGRAEHLARMERAGAGAGAEARLSPALLGWALGWARRAVLFKLAPREPAPPTPPGYRYEEVRSHRVRVGALRRVGA
ncbi:MAG: hypothetical protein FJ138_18030 [Deltaproteobacteria bacterium]|nr:hypothetical protein [Deltaproteobacteria bacterium]